MWQRIQTLFLLLAAISLGLLFWQPVMSFFTVSPRPTTELNMLQDGLFEINDHIIFIILAGLGTGLSLISIFLFKNRPLQMNLAKLSFIASVLIIVLGGIFFYKEYANINAAVDTKFSGEFGLLSPVFASIFTMLSIRFIKKDEDLVRSSDRLR